MKRFIGWLIEHVTDSRDWFYYDWDGKTYKVIILRDQMPSRWYALRLGNRVFSIDRNFTAICYAIHWGSTPR